MSLKPQEFGPIPAETARVAEYTSDTSLALLNRWSIQVSSRDRV